MIEMDWEAPEEVPSRPSPRGGYVEYEDIVEPGIIGYSLWYSYRPISKS